MSTLPRDQRKPLDGYYTQPELALAICRRVARQMRGCPPDQILEPSAGSGVFVRAARRVWPNAVITAVEINRKERKALVASGADEVHIDDCTNLRKVWPGRFDLIIGNPPYSVAQAHIEALQPLLRPAVDGFTRGGLLWFLMRMSFLCSQMRAVTIWKRPDFRYLMPLAERPDFTGGGGDHSEYGVFAWERDYGRAGAKILRHLWWR